jgi:hypothetical protein
MPNESVRCVEITDRNWIKRMGNSVESGFQIALPIRSDVVKPSLVKRRHTR